MDRCRHADVDAGTKRDVHSEPNGHEHPETDFNRVAFADCDIDADAYTASLHAALDTHPDGYRDAHTCRQHDADQGGARVAHGARHGHAGAWGHAFA